MTSRKVLEIHSVQTIDGTVWTIIAVQNMECQVNSADVHSQKTSTIFYVITFTTKLACLLKVSL